VGNYITNNDYHEIENGGPMQYVLKERIGKPDLFCGRDEEMNRIIDWAE
jgi:hypothetical protein